MENINYITGIIQQIKKQINARFRVNLRESYWGAFCMNAKHAFENSFYILLTGKK